jgi:hypothetical protein
MSYDAEAMLLTFGGTGAGALTGERGLGGASSSKRPPLDEGLPAGAADVAVAGLGEGIEKGSLSSSSKRDEDFLLTGAGAGDGAGARAGAEEGTGTGDEGLGAGLGGEAWTTPNGSSSSNRLEERLAGAGEAGAEGLGAAVEVEGVGPPLVDKLLDRAGAGLAPPKSVSSSSSSSKRLRRIRAVALAPPVDGAGAGGLEAPNSPPLASSSSSSNRPILPLPLADVGGWGDGARGGLAVAAVGLADVVELKSASSSSSPKRPDGFLSTTAGARAGLGAKGGLRVAGAGAAAGEAEGAGRDGAPKRVSSSSSSNRPLLPDRAVAKEGLGDGRAGAGGVGGKGGLGAGGRLRGGPKGSSSSSKRLLDFLTRLAGAGAGAVVGGGRMGWVLSPAKSASSSSSSSAKSSEVGLLGLACVPGVVMGAGADCGVDAGLPNRSANCQHGQMKQATRGEGRWHHDRIAGRIKRPQVNKKGRPGLH